MHFLMHPQANSVELMSCGKTASTIIDALMQRLPRNGLVPFRVQRESVGFILNRIWAAIKREALMVVQEGVATPEDIDRIWHEVFHSPAAPFRMMDQVGLDVVRDIEEHYAQIREGIPEGPSHTVARVHRSRTSRSEERPGVLLRLSRGRQGWPIKRSDGPGWAGVGRLLIPGFEWHRTSLLAPDGGLIAAISAAVETSEADRLDDIGEELKKAVATLGPQYGRQRRRTG